ncbi:MAG: S-methyl-5'-thioadenosine phosphorylase [Candidatus Ratteibacteria bacterium]|nr:S-methyl-5'-thioadenosine phosphorylase [Candidatus Ratteibacteria bacterium]
MPRIGIIGGSGLYGIEGFTNKKWVRVDTPFGKPSDEYLIGKINGEEIAFLPRHGRGHPIMPSQLNYRANIFGMKKLGVEHLVSFSTVGSFKKEIKPLDIVIIDQFVDRTNQARKMTFFGDGVVAHIAFAEPVCPVLSDVLYLAAKKLAVKNNINVHKGGTYLNMEGPAFSTEAESFLYKSWGMDVIGMTNMPEAKLAREAEMCFVTVAMVTDYDAWYEEESVVTVDMIVQNLNKNVQVIKELIKDMVSHIPQKRNCLCSQALKNAIITQKELIPDERKKELELIIGKYINL